MKYYIHSVDTMEDEKVILLFKKYGYEGTGLFHAILEKLARQEVPIKTDALKFQLKVGKRLEKIWNFMEEIGLISSNNGETFNEQLLKFSEKYQIKSEKNRKKISQWREKQSHTKNVTGYEPFCNHDKDKISKDKISKEENNKRKTGDKSPEAKPDFLDILLNDFCEEFLKIRNYKFDLLSQKKEKAAVAKLLELYKKSNPAKNTQECREDFAGVWRKAINIQDKWIYENVSPSIILSKWNTIKSIINNSHNGRTEKLSDEFLELAAKVATGRS